MNNKQKQRKDQKRKERAKKRVLARRNFLRTTRKLEEELEQIKKMQEEKIEPIRKQSNDT
jgi:hypothetical protein